MSWFLNGLSDEIQHAVRMFRPNTLHYAYYLAKLQEATLASVAKRAKSILDRGPFNTRGVGSRFGSFSQSQSSASHRTGPNASSHRSLAVSNTGSTNPKSKAVGRTLSSKEIDEKRAKNLCFFCEEKFFPGHKCLAQVCKLEVIEEESSQVEEGIGEIEDGVKGEETKMQEGAMQLSLSALNGVTGRVKNSPLHILLDSSSTHNFLDVSITKKLHCEIKKVPPLQVMVANG